MFAHPIPKVIKGARTPYAGLELEIVNVDNGGVEIRRVANDELNTPGHSVDPNFHPLDHFKNTQVETDKGGSPPFNKTRLGPVEQKTLTPDTQLGGEIVEKVDVLGPELKQPRPPLTSHSQFGGEPSATYTIYSTDATLQSAYDRVSEAMRLTLEYILGSPTSSQYLLSLVGGIAQTMLERWNVTSKGTPEHVMNAIDEFYTEANKLRAAAMTEAGKRVFPSLRQYIKLIEGALDLVKLKLSEVKL
jgi:hypothetical protein